MDDEIKRKIICGYAKGAVLELKKHIRMILRYVKDVEKLYIDADTASDILSEMFGEQASKAEDVADTVKCFYRSFETEKTA